MRNDDNDDSKQSGHAVVDSAISRLEKLSLASSDVIDNDDDDEGGGGGGGGGGGDLLMRP